VAAQQARVSRKILIEENRITNCKVAGICIESAQQCATFDSFSAIKIQKNRISGNQQGIVVRNLATQELEISACDISFNRTSNLLLQSVVKSPSSVFPTRDLETAISIMKCRINECS